MVEKKLSHKIAFVVGEAKQIPYFEIKEVVDFISKKNVIVDVVSYFDDSVSWQDYDLINFNICVNYYQNSDKFIEFCRKIKDLKITTCNSLQAILWNMNKKYLQDLEKKGFDLAPTIWIEKGDVVSLESLIKGRNWQKFIIKPTLSAGSFNTKVFEFSQIIEASQHLQQIINDSTVIIQEFLPQVLEKGEYSAIFIDKKFSHLVLKTPAVGDFRAGIRQGASAILVDAKANSNLVDYAQRVVDSIEDDLLYARVDFVVADKIYLMELELIEPLLYSEFFNQGLFVQNYGESLLKRLQR